MVSRSSGDQKIGDGAMGGVVATFPAGRPTDHSECVVVAFTNYIAASVGESPYDIQMPCSRRPMHRVSVVAFLAGIGIDAAVQQKLDHPQVTVLRGDMQHCVLVRLG